MSFLSPLTLIGLSLVALPLAIHLLVRRRARRMDFPSLKFLRETPSFKLHPRKVRQPLLLAVRAAAIILLVLGLARPLLTSFLGKPAPIRFIVMDASQSMKARGRADAAKEQARVLIKNLAPSERAAVIAIASDAIVLSEPTADQSRLIEAVERYAPLGSSADYGAGFDSIRSLLRREPRPTGEIDIISDFQRDDSGRTARPRAPLSLKTYPLGAQLDRNAFAIDESVRWTDRGAEISATEMLSDVTGRTATRHTWLLDAKEGERPGISWRTESNGQITGRIGVTTPDDFDEDDERFFAFESVHGPRVLLIEGEAASGPYLRAALEVAGDESNATMETKQEPAGDLGSYSLLVVTLHGSANEAEAALLSQYARGGGNVLMFLSRDLDTESWTLLARTDAGKDLPFENLARADRSLSLNVTDSDAPQFRQIDGSARWALEAVRVHSGYVLNAKPTADTLVRWNDGTPALISSRIGDGTIMLLGTSPARDAGELGTSPSFPVFISSIVGSSIASRQPSSLAIGDAVRLPVGMGARVKITGRQGKVVEASAGELVARPLGFFNEPGIYRLDFDGRTRFIAFNSPPSESERTLASNDQVKQVFHTSGDEVQAIANDWRESSERRGSTWRYLLIAAFLLIIAELLIATHQRRIAT